MKRYISLFAIAISSLFLFNKCDSFLEIDPTTNVRTKNAVTDLNSMNTVLLGAYSPLKDSYYRGKYALLIPELLSDNVFTSVRNSGRGVTLDDYAQLPTEDYLTGLWEEAYAVAANASLLIENESEVKILEGEEEERNQIIGEAYGLIGLAYFDLVRFYAQPYSYTENADHPGVPIVKEVKSDLSELAYPSRSTVKETYDWIVNNLQKAIDIMPENQIIEGERTNNKTRFSKMAIKALLAKVNMYMENWEKARDLSDDVIKSGKYSLLGTDQLVGGFKEDNNSETILEVAFSRSDNEGSGMLSYIYNLSGYADQQATEDLWDQYTESDVRKGFIRKDSKSNAEDPAYVATKYDNISDYNENYKVLRFSDMYLIRAEASAHLGEENNARSDLDKIRERANPNVSPSSESGQALLNKILKERRKEFAFEGERLFDLARNNKKFIKYRSPLTVGKPIERTIDYPGRDELHLKAILPIPQREIDANENLQGEQNPGY